MKNLESIRRWFLWSTAGSVLLAAVWIYWGRLDTESEETVTPLGILQWVSAFDLIPSLALSFLILANRKHFETEKMWKTVAFISAPLYIFPLLISGLIFG